MALMYLSLVLGFSRHVHGFDVVHTDAHMQQVCSWPWETQDMDVVYPKTTEGRFPIIAYAHGWKAGGDRVDADLRDLFDLLASAGYILVAPKAPYDHAITSWCPSQYKDLYTAMEWAKTAPELKQIVDASSPAGVFGHSMGGRSASIVASMKDKPESLTIGAAVIMHPACALEACGDFTQIAIPSMLIAGQKDTEVYPSAVQSYYDKLNGVPKAYIEAKGVQHTDPETYHQPNKDNLWGTPPRIENHYVLDWMNCFLKQNRSACALAACHEPQVCSPTSACKHEGIVGGQNILV